MSGDAYSWERDEWWRAGDSLDDLAAAAACRHSYRLDGACRHCGDTEPRDDPPDYDHGDEGEEEW